MEQFGSPLSFSTWRFERCHQRSKRVPLNNHAVALTIMNDAARVVKQNLISDQLTLSDLQRQILDETGVSALLPGGAQSQDFVGQFFSGLVHPVLLALAKSNDLRSMAQLDSSCLGHDHLASWPITLPARQKKCGRATAEEVTQLTAVFEIWSQHTGTRFTLPAECQVMEVRQVEVSQTVCEYQLFIFSPCLLSFVGKQAKFLFFSTQQAAKHCPVSCRAHCWRTTLGGASFPHWRSSWLVGVAVVSMMFI